MSKQFKHRTQRGFTLVELSIVIVIIGFLVAGIAAGSSMIKQAQIRSVISDVRSYQTAFNNFKSRFNNQVPGDMTTAASFWATPLCAVADADCNGDGDGYITKDTTSKDETRPALKHLALANMISAGIPIVPDAASHVALVPGTNAPSSKISGVGYYLVGSQLLGGNVMYIGKPTSLRAADDDLTFSAFTPEEAFNLDAKLDDAIIVGSLDTPLNRALGMLYPNAAMAFSASSGCGGGVRSLLEPLDSFINPAVAGEAPKDPPKSTPCFSGASSGSVIAADGDDARAPCVVGGGYNLSNTEPSCVTGNKQ